MTDIFELQLSSMAYGGNAVGKHKGRTIFVPYGIPGELISARIVQDKERYAVAEIVEVVNAAEARVEPR